MKAKEYAKQFFERIEDAESVDDIGEALIKTVNDFIKEFYVLVRERNIQTPRALVSAFKELQSKWVALCERLINSKGEPFLKEDGLFDMLEKSNPKLWELYQTSLLTESVKKRRKYGI